MNVHQTLFMFVLGTLLSARGDSDPVQLTRSTEDGHHVTIEERASHYLVRANVRVKLPADFLNRDAKHLVVALVTNQGGEIERRVMLKRAMETWRFYFNAPKYKDVSDVKYGLVAKVDGRPPTMLAVWEVQDKEVNLGSKQEPLALAYQIEIPITQEVAPGEFKVNVAKETRVLGNDYEALAIVKMSSAEKPLPRSIRDDEMAVRLGPK